MAEVGEIDPDLVLALTFDLAPPVDLERVPVGETTVHLCGDKLAERGLEPVTLFSPLSRMATLTGLMALFSPNLCLEWDLELGRLWGLDPG